MVKTYYRVGELAKLAKLLKVWPSTIRNYSKLGKIKFELTPSGQRIFPKSQFDKEEDSKYCFYIRSSNENKSLLDNQLKELRKNYGNPVCVYKDVGSGLNENRKGLKQLINDLKSNKFNIVCVTYKDRLSRFGTTYIEEIFNQNNVKLEVLNPKEKFSLEEELMQDFMSLIASFSGEFYRLRGNENKLKLLKKVESELNG